MRLLSKFIASVLVLCSAQVAFAESSQMVSDEFIAELGLTQDEFQQELDEADAALASDGPYTEGEISAMLSPTAAPEEGSNNSDNSMSTGSDSREEGGDDSLEDEEDEEDTEDSATPPSFTETPVFTETAHETPQTTAVPSFVATDAPTVAPTAAQTSTVASESTATASPTESNVASATATPTNTNTPTPTATATPTLPMCCICFESAVQGKDGKWRTEKCKNADWGSLCGESDKKVNCYTYKGKEKARTNCDPSLRGLQCRAKHYLFMASDDKRHEKKCLIQDCYNYGSDVPTETSVVGRCSPSNKDDKTMLCDMAKSVAIVLARKKDSPSYSWLVPAKDVTNGGTQCPAPGSDAFRERAGTIYKIVASKKGVEVFSQTFPNTTWVKKPNFCGSTNISKTITIYVFTKKGCKPCDELRKKLEAEKTRLAKDGIKLVIIVHDIDSDRGKKVAKDFRIDTRSLPVSAMGNASGGMDDPVDDALESIKQAEQRIKFGRSG